MTKNEFILKLREYNEDEIFYRQYYNAKSQKWMLDEFLAQQDPTELLRRRLLIPEIANIQIPEDYADEDFFHPDSHSCVFLSKHNRFTPPFRHRHIFYEMTYILEGTCTQSINGKELTLTKGDFCLISPNTPHAVCVFDSSIVINILIRRSMFEDNFFHMIRDTNLISFYFNQTLYTDSYKDYIVFHTGEDRLLQDLVLDMFLEFQEQKNYYETVLTNMLMILFSYILRNYEDTVTVAQDIRHNHPDTLKMIAYMEDHYPDITLPKLAEHFYFSVQYCSRLLKQGTGKNFSKLLQSIRFEKARLLLKNTNIPIAEIGNQTGFQNPEYFNRRFKQLFHMTPGEYRRQPQL